LLGNFALPNSVKEPPSISVEAFSSILHCKAACEHSTLSGRPFNPQDLSGHFNREESNLIWNSIQINFDGDVRAHWRTVGRKYKCAVLADVTTAAFALSRLAVSIGPLKRNRRL
jgi:hypothetical protein